MAQVQLIRRSTTWRNCLFPSPFACFFTILVLPAFFPFPFYSFFRFSFSCFSFSCFSFFLHFSIFLPYRRLSIKGMPLTGLQQKSCQHERSTRAKSHRKTMHERASGE